MFLGHVMKRNIVWTLLWGTILLIGVWPLWGTLPAPKVKPLVQAVHVRPDGPVPVTLPVLGPERGSTVHYRIMLDIERFERPLYVFIPLLSQRVTLHMEGRLIADSSNRAFMHGMASGTSLLALLPEDLLGAGVRILDVHVQATGLVRAYLSPLYVGTSEELAPYFRLSVFLLEYVRAMIFGGQVLMVVLVLVIWMYRPGEPLFGWLTALLASSLFAYVGLFGDLATQLRGPSVYAIMLGSAASATLVIVSMIVGGQVPPRWLKFFTFGAPMASLACAVSGLFSAQQVVLFFNIPFNVAGMLASAVIVCHAALIRGSREARLLVVPACLMSLVVVDDFAAFVGFYEKPLPLSMYYRFLFAIGIAMILMRRLGISLMRLDDSNERLRRSLVEREAELEQMHREDRRKAAEQARQDERQRLIVDLHDGLSGHLASIIAQSEKAGFIEIERTAREALDDLRLVIHSLDVEDKELRAALSGLRERLERQLRRIDVELAWSTANLPEVTGVTPTQALNVLRIVQESITNAISHGKATEIKVHGSTALDGRACLSVENDGIPFNPRLSGNGLINMKRRVAQLGGEIFIEPLQRGTRVRLLLPLQLPAATAFHRRCSSLLSILCMSRQA